MSRHNKNEQVKGIFINMTRAWNKEKILSPRHDSNPWPPEHRAGVLSIELRELIREQGHFTDFMFDKHPAYC